MSTTYFNCPSCPTPVAVDRFERAFGETRDYWVCPECDFTFNARASLFPHRQRLIEAGADSGMGGEGVGEARQLCSTSV
jgi:hypothetical protein